MPKLLILDESYGGRLRHVSRQFRGDVVATKLDGFHRRSARLRPALGLRVEHAPVALDQLADRLLRADADAVLYVPSWRHPAEDFEAALAALPDRSARVPLALFDTFDQTSSPFFASLPHVDLYLKSQLLRDRSRYSTAIPGGNTLAEWVQHHRGFDLGDWHFGSTVPTGSGDRLVCGWNMGVSRFYRYLARLSRLVSHAWRRRPVLLNRRFSIPDPARVAKWEWYQEYRRYSGLEVTKLTGDIPQTDTKPISRRDYQKELLRSRIVFSPFGWGEVCFRDFEAVACGAVLVKPDMAHLETYPNIYEDKVNYMAVRWDLADLPDVCHWLLDHPTEAEQIATNARRRLGAYLKDGSFAASVRGMMARLVPEDLQMSRAG